MKTRLLVLLLLVSFSGLAQGVVSGRVTDEKDQTLPGVSVVVKGTTQGTVTDIDGVFTLQDVPANSVLVFSFIGYLSQEVVYTSQTKIDVKLDLDVETLQEVVVIGYGTQKKSVATASLSKVDAKALGGFSVPRVDQMLQGQVSGVMFKPSSGQPGSSMQMMIRGIATNGDNSPLVIIDGFVASDGMLQSLNPADIESVQIMKDGASLAIYGARAANGIIYVTSKKPKDGQTSVSYNGSYGVQNPWRVPELLNASQYVELLREKHTNGGTTPHPDFPTESTITADTDWMDKIFENGSIQSHNVTLMSGTKNSSVLASLSYFDQKGVIAPEKSFLKRATARINAEQKINDYLRFGQNMFVMRWEGSRIGENNEFGTPIADALVYDPTTPAYNPGSQYGFAQSPFVQKEYINPLSRLFITNGLGSGDEFMGNVFIKVSPIKDLVITSDVGGNYYNGTGKGFTPSYAFTPSMFNDINDIGENMDRNYRWQWENYATYTKTISKHTAEITVGTTAQQRGGNGFSVSSSGVPEEVQFNRNFWYVTNTPDSMKRGGSYGIEKEALLGVFGRAVYNYDEKYLLSLTLRRDGSTKFGPKRRYGNFPSVGLGWVASRESFWPESPVNFLKVRASYGVNGSDRIGNLMYTSVIETVGAYPFGKPGNVTVHNGQALGDLPNPFVQWEESIQWDGGFEAGLWNDMLTFEFDYYRKITSGLLMRQTMATLVGMGEAIANVGEVTNSGIEIEANFRKDFGGVSLQLGGNVTTLKNNVTKMAEEGAVINGYSWPIRNTVITRMEVGKPIGYFRGYKTDGIFGSEADVFAHINAEGDPLQPDAVPGDLKFVDTNKDGLLDANDIVEIGKPWADVMIGFNGSVAFKGIDFRFLLASNLGNQVFRSYERQDVIDNNYSVEWLDRWSETNPDGKYPRLTTDDSNNNARPSDFYVEDASFLRLRNIQLGYTIPSSLTKKAGISNLRIYVSGDNLLTVTGYTGFDPEIGGGVLGSGIDKGFYPSMKTVSGGLSLSF